MAAQGINPRAGGAAIACRWSLGVIAQDAACTGQPAVLRAVVGLGARPKVFGPGALLCMLRARATPDIGPWGLGDVHPRPRAAGLGLRVTAERGASGIELRAEEIGVEVRHPQ